MDIELLDQETEDISSSGNLLLQLVGAKLTSERPNTQRELQSELSLGLSLGGCFAVEPREMRLSRSSSNATIFAETPIGVSVPLARTCSLPLDADEESRKRKEIQSFGREEAKRKRNEGRRRDDESARSAALRRNCSDYDGKSMEGSDISSLSNSSSVSSFPDTNQKSILADPLSPRLRSLNSLQKDDGALTRMTGNLDRPKDTGRDMMEEMPCVSVKGDGLHGRRIEGFLYKYRQGEELRIVCVCHGNFFTPAEFVKHAGGGDVSHPLRHIVVNPSPSVYY